MFFSMTDTFFAHNAIDVYLVICRMKNVYPSLLLETEIIQPFLPILAPPDTVNSSSLIHKRTVLIVLVVFESWKLISFDFSLTNIVCDDLETESFLNKPGINWMKRGTMKLHGITKPVAQRQEMVIGTLALLLHFLILAVT